MRKGKGGAFGFRVQSRNSVPQTLCPLLLLWIISAQRACQVNLAERFLFGSIFGNLTAAQRATFHHGYFGRIAAAQWQRMESESNESTSIFPSLPHVTAIF